MSDFESKEQEAYLEEQFHRDRLGYNDDVDEYEPTAEDIVAVAEEMLLINGGVDNWEWYGDSLEDNNYITSANKYEDAKNFLQALENGGVDNWEWYGESVRDLAGYQDYVESLSKPSSALDYYEWEKAGEEAAEAEAKAAADSESKADSDNENTKPEEATIDHGSDRFLYDHIVDKYGEKNADKIFIAVKEDGKLYKQYTFPKEFKKALGEIQKGVEDPLEKARMKLLELLEKNGKLDILVDRVIKDNIL